MRRRELVTRTLIRIELSVRHSSGGQGASLRNSQTEAESVLSYLSCRLTRLLILLHKPSQHVTRKVYSFVPSQKWTRQWTDEDLYAKYALTGSEIAFIEKIVRPMDLSGDASDETVSDDDE